MISPGVAALTRARLSHVDQNYLRADTYAGANVPLIEAQADIALAQALGGGLVAGVDGIRFVVPVPSIYARPNPKYFGRRRGATWLNLLSDQSVGLASKVVSGTPRDSLHIVDLIYRQDGGRRPEVIISDTGSYSDIAFGLLQLLGFAYRPELADLPDAKLWRIDLGADYGPLNAAARGRIDLQRIRQHYPDMLRLVASIHTGAVSAHDVIRMLSSGGKTTQLGDALAHYGRIFKTLHVLVYVHDETYRRHVKGISNLQEGRHDLGRHVFHGGKGELRQHYQEGMEDQLGALGLVLNCITLWNTVYLDAALTQLRADGHPAREEDIARLSVYIRRHLNVEGRHSFQLPELAGARRPLRDPDAADEDQAGSYGRDGRPASSRRGSVSGIAGPQLRRIRGRFERIGDTGADYHLVMSRCTAPVQGHRTASGAAACPACGGRNYGYSSPPRPYYPSSGYAPHSGGGGGSVGDRTRPRWSPSGSSVTYTPDQVRALTPYRRTVELRGQLPELRDLFLCHAWDDRRGVATELNDLLEAEGVSVWFSEKDILLGQPFMREIDRGLAKSRAGLVLITPALLTRVNNRGVSDKELSELLARDQLILVVHETTYDEVRRVSPLLGSRHGLDTAQDSMKVIATKIAELVALDDELVTVESD